MMTINNDYQSMDFLLLADQWLIHYASITSKTPIPTLFAVGHALELYAKAAILKNDQGINVYKEGHDIWSLIVKLKTDYNILETYDIRERVLSQFLNGNIAYYESDSSDAENYRMNMEFYWVASLLKDIKYLGTYCRSISNGYFLVVKERNPYWIPILRELRQISIPNIKLSKNYTYGGCIKAETYIKAVFS